MQWTRLNGQRFGTGKRSSHSDTHRGSVPYRTYSKAELVKIVDDARDSSDVRLLVLPEDRLNDTIAQIKQIVANSTIEPAACADFATGGGVQLDEGAVISIGASASSNSKSAQMLSLVSGVAEDRLTTLDANKAKDASGCADIQMTVLGQAVSASTKSLPTAAKTPGAVAFLTTIGAAEASQFQLILTAVKGGVVLTTQSTGSEATEADLPKLEAMLDSAAALIK